MPRVMQVIESTDRRGEGKPGDPVRLVMQYHTLDGELLAERDQWAESELDEKNRCAKAER